MAIINDWLLCSQAATLSKAVVVRGVRLALPSSKGVALMFNTRLSRGLAGSNNCGFSQSAVLVACFVGVEMAAGMVRTAASASV